MKPISFAHEKTTLAQSVNEQDAETIAMVMRDQHGSNAETFVRQMIRYHRENPIVTASWNAVLAALLWKAAAQDIRDTKER